MIVVISAHEGICMTEACVFKIPTCVDVSVFVYIHSLSYWTRPTRNVVN